MVARLVECTDYDTTYGILTVENASVDEVQDKIYEIKNRFYDDGFDDWCIDDVLNEFPEEWEWVYTRTDDNDIIRI